MDDNLTQQADEVEALSAIYGDEWCVLDEASRTYCIEVTDGQEKPKWKICLQVLLPTDYPSDSAPLFQLNAPWLRDEERYSLSESLDQLCADNAGDCVLYLLVERIRELLVDKVNAKKEKEEAEFNEVKSHIETLASEDSDWQETFNILNQKGAASYVADELAPIQHGDPITDRRSTFQAHLATPVVSLEQVKQVRAKLYENRKISNATHNIAAYRIYVESRDSWLQDCDDDGETHAGGRLLHLLQILNARNVLVIVSRWYGGILLGPDRFKHINNAARSVLETAGFIEQKESSGSKGKDGKSKKGNKEQKRK